LAVGVVRSFRAFRRTIVWQLIVEQRAWFGLLLLTGLAVFGVIMTMVAAIRDAIDLAVIEQTEPLRQYVDTLLVLAILGLLAGFALRMVLARIAYTLEYDVRLRLYRKLLGLDPGVPEIHAFEPVAATGFAYAWLGESLTTFQLVGALVVLVAIVLAQTSR
jgi:drug/metabolite transporter (DMT)-like permease